MKGIIWLVLPQSPSINVQVYPHYDKERIKTIIDILYCKSNYYEK